MTERAHREGEGGGSPSRRGVAGTLPVSPNTIFGNRGKALQKNLCGAPEHAAAIIFAARALFGWLGVSSQFKGLRRDSSSPRSRDSWFERRATNRLCRERHVLSDNLSGFPRVMPARGTLYP